MDRNDLFKKLFKGCNGYIELRAIREGDNARICFIFLDGSWQSIGEEVDKFCEKHKNMNLYYGLSTRDGKGGAGENVVSIPCVWAEIDFKNIKEDKVKGVLDCFPLKPSIVVNSGGGFHLYFLLDKPVDLTIGSEFRGTDVRKVNDWIRLELNKLGECALDDIGDIPRIIRLPNTKNHKYPDKPLCEIIEINDYAYSLVNLLEKIPESVGASMVDTYKKPLKELYSGSKEGSRNTDMTRLIGSWVSDGLGFDECMENALMINMKTNHPMDTYEISSIINSIQKREYGKTVILVNRIHNTELGNSQRITNSYGGIIRYCGAWKKWLVWNAQYGAWQIADNGQVQRFAIKTIQNMFREAARISDSQERGALVKWGLASETATRIQAMIRLAESSEGVAISPDDLDRNPWLLNCHNGTIDLRTGNLNDHDKSDLITKVIPVTYDPNAECPKWLGFLDKIMDGNQELISFLQRTVGYALTGDTREQCFFILHGDGANGKSTFIKTIGALLGDYAQAASFETFLSKNQGNVANNDIARMQGKRFISAVEAEESRRLAENVIKQITGGDVVAARFLYREYFEFVPQFKIFLTTNHKPKINCNDPAIWRRVKLIPFTVSIPEEKQILDLDEQLKDEFSGILNWAIEGCLDWQRNGLQTPEEVVNATKDYRNEMDTVNEFLEECCTLLPNVKVNPTALFDAYKKFCEKNGEIFLSMKKFGASLNKKGYEVTKTNSRTWRLGIGLPVEERANDYSEWSD